MAFHVRDVRVIAAKTLVLIEHSQEDIKDRVAVIV
jgi:hypothetical protein